MTTRPTTPAPIDCDACGKEINTIKGGALDCEVVDLHDGTPVKDVCAECRDKPLSEIFPHILKRATGHPMRLVPAPAETEAAPAGAEAVTIGTGDIAEVPADLVRGAKKK